MGGKSGGGQQTPYEAPNSLSSAQSLRIIDAVSEGVVSGFANGDDAPFKSVYFDDTPVQNSDGSYNFNGVTGYFQRGEQDQSYVPGFDASERTVAVSAAVKQNQPIVRAVTDELVSRLRITVAVERNAQVEDNGDTVPADTLMRVELINSNGVQASNQVRFNEKSSGTYYQDVEFDVVPQVPFNIRVFRISPDSKTDKVSNNTYFSSYVEIVDVKLSYPHTAFAALSIDSAQFGNQIPRRNYLMKGRLVKVPSNYNPETRQYTGGTWDGSFKTAWTNNPAWVFYDVLTQPRFSTLARRLNVADIDKWSLYQIGKYCDEPVDDGFGGKEPRFVCNAYITDLMQAGEFLNNLASVFTGLPVWNGQQVSVVMDADADPVAQYTNANVKDGLFNYAGAALKSIHTAVHVQYIDKYDGYRAKTEYVADNEAIARYGLNIKQITAFGCDSRGQAARFGAWTLQTELRQQNAVTFEIGREGLKHLPYDIVQIMDNQYAGAELSGRVAAISGNVLTLDRPVSDAVGALVFYSEGGSLKSAKVTAAAGNKVTLEREVPLQAGDTWVLSGKVKPRLYRAIGIKENTDAGTYTVTALLHDPKKYAAVDSFAHFDHEITTLHNTAPVLTDAAVNTDGGTVVMTWDNLAANGQVLTYDIKIYRNNSLYRHIPDAQTAEIRLENLPNGNYRAEIRGRNARGVLSAPLVKAWSIDYAVTGLRTTPKTLSVAVDWVLPQTVVSELVSELWYSKTNNLQTATKLASLAYPQNNYTLTGVGVADVYYFWVRIRDIAGNTGEFTAAVQGRADNNPAPIVQQIQGAIGKSALSRELIDALNRDMTAAAGLKVSAEAAERAKALQEEARARTAAIQAESSARTAELARKSSEIGTRIAATEAVNAQQAQQIQTVTSTQGNTAAGLEAEKKARADGDRAEAQVRETLAVRLGNAESGISALRETVTRQDAARSSEINTLTAKLDGMQVGGRNLIRDSAAEVRNANYLMQTYSLSDGTLQEGEPVVLTLWGELGSDREAFWPFNSDGWNWLGVMKKVSDGVYRIVTTWKRSKNNPSNDRLLIYCGPNTGKTTSRIDRIKLERGTVATDWTPAPEDGATAASEVAAQFAAYKTAQAEVDKAQTSDLTAAKSALAGAVADITSIKTTKADKSEVAALARATLASEWKSAADAAKTYSDGLNRDVSAKVDRLSETLTRQDSARASEISTLTAKLDGMQVGGRNLIRDSAAEVRNANYLMQTYSLSDGTLQEGEPVVLTLWGELGSDREAFWPFNSDGWNWLGVMKKVSDGVYRIVTTWKRSKNNPSNDRLLIYCGPNTGKTTSRIDRIKLERGTVATDWTPAPEDSATAASNLAAAVQQTSTAVTELGGKVQSLYTLKTEAVVDGRKAIAGIAIGADGQTGSGEILLMSNKVGYVDPKDKSVTPAFVTVIENGKAKQALNGDLFATGSILAKHIAANQTIEAPTLNGATVNAGLIKGGTIRGARIEAVDLEAANIIGDVVAVRTFELKQSPLGYQELICQIPDSRKTRRTVIVPPVFAVAENGAVVSLQLHMDGVIQREVTIQSPEKRIARNEKFSVWVPGPPPLYMKTPQEVPLSFSVPFHLPKTGSISFQKGIDGAAHSLHILCRISGNFDYSPLGDLSGIVCLVV